MDYTLCIWIGVEGLEADKKEDIDKNFKLRINEQDLKIDRDNVKRSTVKDKEGEISFLSYVIRREVETLYLGEDFLYTPFDTLVLNTKVELTSYQSKVFGKHVRYIFHEYENKETKILFKDTVDRLPEFNVIYNQANIELGSEKKDDEKLKYYPTTTFSFALYREPGKAIIQAFIPMFILSIFILLTMFPGADPAADFDAQLPNLGMIFLAYVAFIPTVKASIPSVAYATFTDYVIYAYLFSTLTSIVYNASGKLGVASDSIYWIFLLATSLLCFLPFAFTVFFFCQYKFNKKGYDMRYVRKEKESSIGFTAKGWSNSHWASQILVE